MNDSRPSRRALWVTVLLGTAIVALAPVATVGTMAYRGAAGPMQEALGGELARVALVAATATDRLVRERFKEIELWASLDFMQEAVTDDADARIAGFLRRVHLGDKIYDSLAVYDPGGKLIAGSNPGIPERLASLPVPSHPGARVSIRILPEPDNVLELTTVIRSKQNPNQGIGILLVRISKELFRNLLSHMVANATPSARAALADQSGAVVVSIPDDALAHIRDAFPQAMARMRTIHSGWGVEAVAGEPVVGYATLPAEGLATAGWSVLVAEPASALFAALSRFRWLMLLICSLTGVFMVGLGVLMARRIVRPILKITSVVDRIRQSEGEDLSARVPVEGDAEIATLGMSMNFLIDRLAQARARIREHTESLAEQVQARTSELERAYKQANEERKVQAQLSRTLTRLNVERLDQEVLSSVLADIVSVTGALAATLYRKTNQELTQVACFGVAAERAPKRVSLNEGAAGCAAATRVLVHFSDESGKLMPEVPTTAGPLRLRQLLALPLLHAEEVYGAFEIGTLTQPNESVMNFLQVIARQLAAFIANDNIHEQVRTLASVLEYRASELEHTNQEIKNQAALLRRQSAELDVKNQQLEEASRYRTRFFAMMSHELRTPLQGIIGFTDLVLGAEGDKLSAQSRKNLEASLLSAEELVRMITNLLDLTRVEAGAMSLRIEEFPLGPLLSACVESARAIARDRDLKVVLHVQPDLPLMCCDVMLVRQIVTNLLGNAVKFTTRGSVTVTAAAIPDAGVPSVRLTVTDTGPGIPEDQLDAIFEAFHQVESGHTRQHGGTGLGLAVVRTFTSRLQGKVSVTSKLGVGTSFQVDLPVKP